MGIGLVMIVAEYYADSIVRHINQEAKVPAWIIGDVVPGDRRVEWARA
jgi:phosphoribosylformylglycinamidine cyclo-ligase